MYSGNASPSFLSMAYGDQPLPYGHYSNKRMDRDDTMDIDGWIYEMRPQSDIAMSYSSGGEPPSLGDLRKIVVSEPSDSNLMYSDGQPPSINDVGRREPSQSEASCNRFEDPDANEVQQPHISEIGVEKNRVINPELWQACAGPLVNLPASGTHVVYFPQGHCEQVAASMKNGGDAQIPNYPNLESKLLCHLHNVTLHVDTETDEVYAQMTLQPVPSFNKEALLNSHPLRKTQKPQTEIFCKTLTESETNIHGDFSVPRLAAEKIFPALDFFMQPPTQELVVTDLHENVWKFRHIYHGQLKRHLLTTGWSSFVSGKKLFPGDSVLFIRDKHGRLLLGVRRANRQPANLSSVLSTYNMHIGILAAAAHAAANNSPFNVFYNPRASPSEFVIPLYKYCKAFYSNQISLGIRFRMMFETKESGTRSYMGKIIDISDLDTVRWKNSQWRNLKVGWDEATTREDRTHISVWEIEPVTTRFFMQPPTKGMLGDESEKFENLYQRKMPWLGENMSLEDPGPNLGQWMNMLQTNQFQPNYVNPLAGMVLQDHVGQNLHRNQQLQKPPQQLTDLTQQTARQNMINQTVQHLSAMQNLEPQLWNQKMVRNQAVLQPPVAILDPISAIKTRYSKTEQYKNNREGEPWKSNHLNHPFGTDLKIIASNVNRF